MAITLTYNSTALTLPSDLLWIDRDSWSPVDQAVQTSVTGATILDIGVRTNGRSITLAGDETHAWINYSTVQTLKTWAAIAGCQLTLNIHGESYSVVFRHHEKPAIDLNPIVDYSSPDSSDWFAGQLKFMSI